MSQFYSYPLFFALFIIGITMVGFGFFLVTESSSKIGKFFSYRSKSAQQSPEKLEFAQKHFAKRLWQFGLLIGVFSFIGILFQLQDLSFVFGTTLWILSIVIYCIWFDVEATLKENFSSNL